VMRSRPNHAPGTSRRRRRGTILVASDVLC
jgi:hypothetical protein